VSIHNLPAPEPLELGFEVATDGTLTQVKRRTIATGPVSVQVACTPGASVPWQAVAVPTGTPPRSSGATPSWRRRRPPRTPPSAPS
jgi:hypothetical protein